MRTRRTFISVKLSSPKMIRTTATTTFSNASSCSLFIMAFRFLLPANLLTFSVPVSPRLGAELGGGRTLATLAARGLADDGRLTAAAALSSSAGAVNLGWLCLVGLNSTVGADLSTGGAGLGAGAGRAAMSGATDGLGGALSGAATGGASAALGLAAAPPLPFVG